MAVKSYNERLFSRGLRGYIHLARFRWLERCIHRFGLKPERVVELGCYDGRARWQGGRKKGKGSHMVNLVDARPALSVSAGIPAAAFSAAAGGVARCALRC